MADPSSRVAAEIARLVPALPLVQLDPLVAALNGAPRVYLHAVGRTGNVLRMFAIRAAQIGLDIRMVGAPTTTAITGQDLLLAASGSGVTSTVVSVAEQARALAVPVWALTATVPSRLAGLADHIVLIPGVAKTAPEAGQNGHSVQPPGSLFEQMLLLFLEEAVLRLMRVRGVGADHLVRRHANLE